MAENSSPGANRERLGWLSVIGLATLFAIAYLGLILLVEQYRPTYLRLVENLGHLAVAVLVIIVVRMIEIPLIQRDRENLRQSIEQKYTSLVNDYKALVEEHTPIMTSTIAIRLKKIYEHRQKAYQDLSEAVTRTERRLLVIAVALHERFSIEHQRVTIAQIISNRPTIDARFLLINPFTTPAVVRAILESEPHEAQQFIDSEGADYLDSQLYTDWHQAYKSFAQARPLFENRVRFYRRDPTVWLVMTDDSVFVEPHTFGRPNPKPGDALRELRMGGHMPVFNFAPDSPVCEILEGHFERLWAMTKHGMIDTSDIESLEPLLDKKKAADFLADQVFRHRGPMLRSLVEFLRQEKQDYENNAS